MVDEGCWLGSYRPIFALLVMPYMLGVAFDLVCRGNPSDQQRISSLRTEMERFYGKPIEFDEEIATDPRFGYLGGEDPPIDTWGIERIEIHGIRSPAYMYQVVLHLAAGTSERGSIPVEDERLFERLVQAGIVDLATFTANRRRRWLRLFHINRTTHVALGFRSMIYILFRGIALRSFPGSGRADADMSFWEMADCIAQNIENKIVSVPLSEIRDFIREVDEQLRAKLGEREFHHLIASFG